MAKASIPAHQVYNEIAFHDGTEPVAKRLMTAPSEPHPDQPSGPAERVILVDENDRPNGLGNKLAVHRQGLRHRGFSVLLFNERGDLLLQRRAAGKYHFGGLWSNACCSHPRIGEDIHGAARRRTREELGVSVPLRKLGEFEYRARDANSGLIEHEYLHIFQGILRESPRPDPAEVGAWRWMSNSALDRAMRATPHSFTPWFRLIFTRLDSLGDPDQAWLRQAFG